MASRGEQIIKLTRSSPTSKRCELTNDIGVGDCVQLQGSYVYILHTEEFDPDLAHCVWSTTTYSRHVQTFFHDQWHQDFAFMTDDGTIVGLAKFDGKEMEDDNRRYQLRDQKVVTINPDLFDQITQVRWTYEC